MKVSDLTGPLLDYWVAKAACRVPSAPPFRLGYCLVRLTEDTSVPYSPSTNWGDGGEILDRLLAQGFNIFPAAWDNFVCANRDHEERPWLGDWESERVEEIGDTPLIAAMRAFVASKYGEQVPEITEGESQQ